MIDLFWFVVLAGGALALAYRRASLKSAALAAGVALILTLVTGAGWIWPLLLAVFLVLCVPLLLAGVRRERIAKPLFAAFRRTLPGMSETERGALEAGTVWWEGELFSGKPDWETLHASPPPRLTPQEQAFVEGPTEELCGMLDDWQITHELGDMPPEVWAFIKRHKFFAMIIPEEYGGLGFSAQAHSAVLVKVAGVSVTAASTISVPNSLGPGELLLKYGTDAQKNYYLPRLAEGREIPCFALTGPRAGSDATSLPDTGVVCKGRFEGREVVGMRLNWNKRYITLAPLATVLGLAFRLYDPEHLLGDTEDYGITCALIPADLPGIAIGRRHFPVFAPFQNGPTQGTDVFVPLDTIVGGPAMAGQGWRMLVECLSVGRSISLPSNATGGAKRVTAATGAYARIRKQFNLPIGYLEGVQEPLARMAAYTYTMDATRAMTIVALDQGEAPAVPASILKYHLTEMARRVVIDGMDVHGGKAVCLGPRNYMARHYESKPVAITVEGANLLTRTMMIFGQGAIRCHPYVLKEMRAAQDTDTRRGLADFDAALWAHVGYSLSNAARALVLGTTRGHFAKVPTATPTRRYYQHVTRASAAFALVADAAMLTLGGSLKRREMLSARLGDLLSMLYLASGVLKRFADQGRPEDDLPLVEWALQDLLYKFQTQMDGLLRNLPNRFMAGLLRGLVFPHGRRFTPPSDALTRTAAGLLTCTSATRKRLAEGVYAAPEAGDPVGLLNDALKIAEAVAPLERRLGEALKAGHIAALEPRAQIDEAERTGVLTPEEAARLRDYDSRVADLIAVDDFAPDALGTQAKPPAGRTRQPELEAEHG